MFAFAHCGNMRKDRRDDNEGRTRISNLYQLLYRLLFFSDFSYELSIPLRTISKLKPKSSRERETGSLERSMGSRLCLPVRPVPSSSGFICFRTKEDDGDSGREIKESIPWGLQDLSSNISNLFPRERWLCSSPRMRIDSIRFIVGE